MIWEEKLPKLTTKEQIDDVTIAQNCNILVVGVHGRKKVDAEITICGSNVSSMSEDPVCPILIIKCDDKRETKENGAYNWMVCLDGSEDALKSLYEAGKLMDKGRDFIEVIHVKKFSVRAEFVEDQANKVWEELGISNTKFSAIDFNVDEP